MQIISLDSLIQAESEESEVKEYLSSFLCHKDKDVQSFLHDKALENEKRAFTRTSLVIDDEHNNDIIGYFTLMIKDFGFIDVSGNTRKRLTNDKHADVFNSTLIAQLGRADSYKGKVPGDCIVQLALGNCKQIYDLSGLRVVCVEYKDEPILHDLYMKNGFKVLQVNSSGNFLAYLRF
ncbi:hypothetical protein OCF63_20615 [Bacillus wiedmannii]|uniref:hypothetical protein n=1 Tax=Bacillus wiedmannii TaxID=1890302 RepID=UPI000BF37C40|nr:hypothetical protein [Bacillus wiedmannii]MCU5500347.1 hypothetical protein [Bacillus wiedmannii]PFZ04034.1 hypothetical protein COL75_11285 [Bacillus wiedmannii]